MSYRDLSTFGFLKKRETTWGAVAAGGSGPLAVTLVTESLKGKPEMAQSKSSRGDRRMGPNKRVGLMGDGGINVEILPGALQTTQFLEEAHAQLFTRTNVTGTDISFSSVDNSVNSASNAFTAFVPGLWITIRAAATAGNNTDGVSARPWAAYVVSATSAKLVLAYITLTTEAAGASVKIDGYYTREGSTLISNTYERLMGAPGDREYQDYRGQTVNTVGLDYPANGIMTMAINTMGKAPRIASATSVFDGETVVAGPTPTESTLADTSNNLKMFRQNGVLSGIMKSFKIDLAQSISYIRVSQTTEPIGISLGSWKVSGSFNGILQNSDAVSILAFNRTAHAVHFFIDCPGATEILIHSIFALTFEEMGDVPRSSETGVAEYTLPWTAEVDPTTGCYCQCVRIPKTV